MNKEITFYINNMAYTINVDDTMEEHLTKYLELGKNNDTKDLLAAYIRITQEYTNFKGDVEQISDKLARF
ncbi:hypothetical protein [Poseidonibacter lekithochrous]|uniref:hypothetical protein n=1 Tax=Poseidonibacter lekithochrous TaxID=1904463 RepID=UPI0008FCB5B7|nr:hypothetical protein [Poseidonibacter lekithochrous]QKJ22817.1 hypothetical protein ALEK_1546 [Poseidonibacter lekithochrous]